MKRTIITFFVLFTCYSALVIPQEQHIFSSKENHYVSWITRSGITPYEWVQSHLVGAVVDQYVWETRSINFWEWTYADIPTEATVTSVVIRFKARKGYNDSFHFTFHNIPYEYGEEGINFYNECNNNIIYENTFQPDENLDILFNYEFSSQSPVGQGKEIWEAISNAVQSGDYYFTLGIREQENLLAPRWEISPYGSGSSGSPSIDLIINYTTPDQYIQFSNKIGTNETYGDLILNNDTNNPLSSGDTPFVSWGDNTVRTNELPFLYNWLGTGTTQKHKVWSFSDQTEHYVLNNEFTATSSIPHVMKANFDQTVPVNISNNLEKAGISQGDIKFKDPFYYYEDNNIWYQPNEFKQYSSPFNIQNNSTNSYGGVFLNQSGPPLWTPPYYSVQAISPLNVTLGGNIGTRRFWFEKWDGTNVQFEDKYTQETGVVFTDEDAEAQAIFKGHLLSSTSTATTGSSQRKIALYDGVKHLVYESLGSIWYTADDGNDWSDEIKIGDGKNPSIAVDDNDGSVHIVWEAVISGNNRTVYHKWFSSGNWSSVSWTLYQSYDATPVVARDMVVWRGSNGLYAGRTTSYSALFPSPLSSSAELPSIEPTNNSDVFRLICKDGIKIKFMEFKWMGYYVSYQKSPTEISGGGTTVYTNPSIANHDLDVYAAWENLSTHKICFRRSTNGGTSWIDFQEFSHNSHYLSKPTICRDDYSDYIRILFQCDTHIGEVVWDMIPSSQWSSILNLGTAGGANIPSFVGVMPASATWVSGSSAPYSVDLIKISLEYFTIPETTLVDNTNWDGVYHITGDVTVNSGKTLSIAPGSVLMFESGKSLIVNGVLDAVGTSNERITFTSATSQSSGSWGYITLDGSGASGSTIRYSDILYGTRIDITNATNVVINNCNLLETDWGIRYYSSTGTIQQNVLTCPSVKHGIVIGNSSTVSCYENTITKIDNTGRGVGILYGSGSDGDIWRNDIQGWDWGIGAIYGSSPDFRHTTGYTINNRITNCNYGVYAYQNSIPVIGIPTGNYGYNNISDNVYKNIYFTSGGTLFAMYTYWNGEPVPSMFTLGSGCSINTQYWLEDDPWDELLMAMGNGPMATNNGKANSNSGEDDDFLNGIELRSNGQYREAMNTFISYIDNHPDNKAAYIELYKCFSKETANDLTSFFDALPVQALNDHKILLSYLYMKSGDVEMAKRVNNNIIRTHPDTKLSANAKINNLYIALYNENDFNNALSIFKNILERPKLTDEFELSLILSELESYAQLHDIPFNKISLPKIGAETEETELPAEYALLGNYPNPFNPSTTIRYALPYQSNVEIIVYDILGREVRNFVIPTQSAGYQNVLWDGKNNYGVQVSSGIYLYRISIKSLENNTTFVKTAKLMMLK